MEFTFQQKSKEVTICSYGAAVNRAVYNVLHEEMGDHYAIHDAFSKSLLNGSTESNHSDVYYFF